MKKIQSDDKYDLICVGGGIMSATLALLLKFVNPKAKVAIFERLNQVARESTATLNNAGTGHSGLCELNYTPRKEDGTIDVTKALDVFNQFERSLEFWSYLAQQNLLREPGAVIHRVPHHSWVVGEQHVQFLRDRYEALKKQQPFSEMKYTEEAEVMGDWFPLIMHQRSTEQAMAATRMEEGTEVNFQTLTEKCFQILEAEFDTPLHTGHEVLDIVPERPDDWLMEVKDLNTAEKFGLDAHHVFIGAGGGALPLLQKVEIPEKEDYGGFPVSGQWLVCKNSEMIEKHHAKVYSRAGEEAPPMSEPHLDTCYVEGEKALIFGPFAGFSTKFLREGSYLDLPKSFEFENLPVYWGAFWHNLDLTKYLLGQVTMDHGDRVEELRHFIKNARPEDWELKVAGQRVQVIKKDKEKGGDVEFGTDVVHSKDGSITALLGASPGASTAVHIMLDVLRIAFPDGMQSSEWREKLNEMIPFWNRNAQDTPEEFENIRKTTFRVLELDD